jgi:putative ABC transport system permease protein
MKLSKMMRAAVGSILKHRMRSLLTMLGIIIGVGAVAILVSLGQSAQRAIGDQITALGSNLIMISAARVEAEAVATGARRASALSLDDVAALQAGKGIAAASGYVNTSAQVIGGIGNWSTQVQGVSPSYLMVRNYTIASGTFFTEAEVQTRAKVAILGRTVADELFPGQNPLGQLIRLRNVPFRVIGVLEPKGARAGGGDEDDIVLAPVTTVLYRLIGGRNIQMIFASAADADNMPLAQEEVRGILRAQHQLRRGTPDDFEIQNQGQFLDFAATALGTMTALLGAIAGVSLLVGGIGIMNIMLVSVTERTREIGIRLAVGARGSDILTQFLVEAVLLCLIGGAIGTGFAFSVAFAITQLTSFTVTVGWSVVTIAFLFSASIGVFFGFYPARQAARLDPIQALRHE